MSGKSVDRYYYLLAIRVTADIGFGIAIPALPGSAGTYDAIIKFALIALFVIPSEQALTYAIVSHSASFFPVVIIGMIYFVIGSVRIKDINKGTEASV